MRLRLNALKVMISDGCGNEISRVAQLVGDSSIDQTSLDAHNPVVVTLMRMEVAAVQTKLWIAKV